MEGLSLAQTLGVVLCANALSLGFVWAGWKMTRHEKNGGRPDDAPWLVILILAAVPLIAFATIMWG